MDSASLRAEATLFQCSLPLFGSALLLLPYVLRKAQQQRPVASFIYATQLVEVRRILAATAPGIAVSTRSVPVAACCHRIELDSGTLPPE